jgi:hypothetical protein
MHRKIYKMCLIFVATDTRHPSIKTVLLLAPAAGGAASTDSGELHHEETRHGITNPDYRGASGLGDLAWPSEQDC